MSAPDEPRLPDHLRAALDGADLEAGIGYTITALTVAEDGWPAVALLSVGEVIATSPTEFRLALWPGTRTTANISRDGRVTLMLVDQGVWYVRLHAGAPTPLAVHGRNVTVFDARVVGIREDKVTYAVVDSGPSFSLPNPDAVLARWRDTVDAVLAMDLDAPPVAPAADA